MDIIFDWVCSGQSLGAMSTLDELVRLWGSEENPRVPDEAVRHVLEFSLSANERQISVVFMHGLSWRPKKVRLLEKDVGKGVVVVRLLGQGVHPLVHLQTMKCLADLAESSENQVKIASYSGVLDALISHLKNRDSTLVQEHTARCLANLAQPQENHMKMASSSVLDPLVKLLANDAPPQVHQQAARCLTNLAVSSDNKERIANYPGLLDALATQLLRHGSSGVHKQTTECLTNLARSQKVQLKIVSDYSVVLDALVRLLGENGMRDVQLQSLKCLTTLSDDYQRNQVAIASHSGLLDALLRLLKYNWTSTDRIMVQIEAARCLLKVLSTPENLLKIGSHVGAFDALLRCLEPSKKRDVQNSAIECFRLLAAAPENQLKIASCPGIVSALVSQLAQVENSTGQDLAAWCLSKVATSMETKALLTSHPGLLKALVAALTRSNSSVVEPSMKCLLKLSQSDELEVRVKIASQSGVIDVLVRLQLDRNWDECLLEDTVICLSYLAEAPENAKQLVSHPDVLVSLVNLVHLDATSGVLEYTAKCLTNLACTEESQVIMASFPGMLNALVFSLSVRHQLTQSGQGQVVKCLALLSTPPANLCKISCYPGVYDALRRLAIDGAHPMAQKEAALCLAKLNLSPLAERDGRIDSPGTSLAPQRRRFQSGDSGPDDWFDDPITCETMCDPVKCNDGHTYDRWTIITHGMHKSPFNPSLTKFFIACDDIDVRQRLFDTCPQQEIRFRCLREAYRGQALQSARALEYEDAIEKLNNVLVWSPSDAECGNELDKIQNLLCERSTPLDTQTQENSFAFPESPELYHSTSFQIDADFSPTSSVLTPEDRPSNIPVLTHEDVMLIREREGSRRAFVSVIFLFSLYFTVFLSV